MKMGTLSSLPSTSISAGSIYFAKNKTNGNKTYGELYYDDESGTRIKISPSVESISTIFEDSTLKTKIVLEDGTIFKGTIPTASADSYGVITTGTQEFEGDKTFKSGYLRVGDLGYLDFQAISRNDGVTQGIIKLNSATIKAGSLKSLLNFNIGNDIICNIDPYGFNPGVTNKYNLGSSDKVWEEIYGSTIYSTSLSSGEIGADSITANIFTGPLTGNVTGNADSASKLVSPISINDTTFDGSAGITTNKWGVSRKISIHNKAGTTGTDVDGSEDEILIIPSTMTNFTSITSTNILGTYLGSTSAIWDSLYIKNPYIYNGTYYHLLQSSATGNRTIKLPDDSGTLLYKENTVTVGSENTPIYVDGTGKVNACNQINVAHGGTGKSSFSTGSILIGGNTGPISEVASVLAGKFLVSNGVSSAPIYTTPTLDWTEGNISGPILNFKINGATYSSLVIPTARVDTSSGSTISYSGIVSTSSQIFTGEKTFSNAVKLNSTLNVTGASTFTGQINASNIKLTNKLKSASNGTSYLTLTDAQATITSPSIYLNGTTIVLSSNNYGTALPVPNNSGQLFLLEDDGVLITTNYGKNNPNSSTNGYGVEGALYFKILED